MKELELRISDLSKMVADAKEGIATLAEEIEGLNDGIKALDKQENDCPRGATLHPSCLSNLPPTACPEKASRIFQNEWSLITINMKTFGCQKVNFLIYE